jgi:hypothetical protein
MTNSASSACQALISRYIPPAWRCAKTKAICCLIKDTVTPVNSPRPVATLFGEHFGTARSWRRQLLLDLLHTLDWLRRCSCFNLELGMPVSGLDKYEALVRVPDFGGPVSQEDHTSHFQEHFASQIVLRRLSADFNNVLSSGKNTRRFTACGLHSVSVLLVPSFAGADALQYQVRRRPRCHPPRHLRR